MNKKLFILIFFIAAAMLFAGCGTVQPDALSAVRQRGVLRGKAAAWMD